ncbi:MAG TPA: carbohydrate binding family 9 domain-containing protein, partial [Chloroflexota bacterium]
MTGFRGRASSRYEILACAGVFDALAVAAITAACTSIGSAQQPVGSSGIVIPAFATAPLHLDGHLDESIWSVSDSITDFRQREPVEGEGATEATTIKLVRDREALYIAVRACDRDTTAIRASQLRRDSDLTVDDYVTLMLDSFHDRRGAFLFRTNPNGAMWDAQLNGFEDVNENWNGIWDVAVTRDSTGWTAEFRIPFQTLRFRRGATSFGFNANRFIRRRNEEVLWRSYGRTEGLLQLLHEGEVTGLVGLGRARGLELRPYALARATASEHDLTGASLGGSEVSAKAGLDAKLAVSPTLTADLTA